MFYLIGNRKTYYAILGICSVFEALYKLTIIYE